MLFCALCHAARTHCGQCYAPVTGGAGRRGGCILLDSLFGSVPADFPSRFSLQESVAQLRAATKRSVLSALAHPEAVGRVDAAQVRLQRVIPMVSNGFKPFFIGRFEARAGSVHLVGRFTLLPWIKVFVAVWLALFTLIGVGIALTAIGSAGRTAPLLALGMGVPALAAAVVAGGRWLARGDVAWLSNVIGNALGSPAPLEAQIDTTVLDADQVPVTLKVMAVLVALAGTINVLIARVVLPLTAPPLLATPVGRNIEFALGLLLLALAVGVYRRQALAWRLSLLCLTAGPLASLAVLLLGQPDPGPPLPIPWFLRAVGLAVGAVIYVLWARWWYAQRVHFGDHPVSPRH